MNSEATGEDSTHRTLEPPREAVVAQAAAWQGNTPQQVFLAEPASRDENLPKGSVSESDTPSCQAQETAASTEAAPRDVLHLRLDAAHAVHRDITASVCLEPWSTPNSGNSPRRTKPNWTEYSLVWAVWYIVESPADEPSVRKRAPGL